MARRRRHGIRRPRQLAVATRNPQAKAALTPLPRAEDKPTRFGVAGGAAVPRAVEDRPRVVEDRPPRGGVSAAENAVGGGARAPRGAWPMRRAAGARPSAWAWAPGGRERENS
ncbi:hypothetical protein U9M48_035509 [Paspalum notatum var. saurae]|uniref:Uncharacterized protein n=1 Tax=Paspalum notatum var. saurae TaxID=547442 RepID=A0AAQ3X8G7_PASNO